MNLLERYQHIRKQSTRLCESLSPEDMTAQSMPDASPAKWHLAHTTWFFETFILLDHGFKAFNPQYQTLFNSYYNSKGEQFQRPQRGLITRPTVEEVFDYRARVDEGITSLFENISKSTSSLIEIGLHHEMQHQELMLTDILHLLSLNPLHPVVMATTNNSSSNSNPSSTHQALQWVDFDETLIEVGADARSGFAYDCECPRHKAWLTPFSLSSRLITNAEWLEFMSDDGYDNPLLWLADGWTYKNQNAWQAPAYWKNSQGRWMQFGLDGLRELQPQAPVCHVSYYEVQAYAQWAGYRLPREHELEHVSTQQQIKGNFLESSNWRPQAAPQHENRVVQQLSLQQIYGDVWQWTQSAYLPYPGFTAEQGALGEYNGKFMCGQFVLRGGSCVTPQTQMRATYRNFFYPWQRWQFTGLRLAQDR